MALEGTPRGRRMRLDHWCGRACAENCRRPANRKISASFGMEAADRSTRRGSVTHRLSLVRKKSLRGMLELGPLEDRLAGQVERGRTPLGCTCRLHGTPRRIGVVTRRWLQAHERTGEGEAPARA